MQTNNIIIVVQICFFTLGRILDDLTWHQVNVENEVAFFESLSIGCMVMCIALSIFRKRKIDGIYWILLLRSQLAFFIVWALQITTIILYFNAFNCQDELPETDIGYFYVTYPGCCLTAVQIVLTTINYSFICNTKAEWAEFLAYEIVLFGEIIYAGHLMLHSINHLQGEPKDYAMFLLTIIIANQMLMMDLIFRAAFEDRERQQANQKKLINFYRKTFMRRTRVSRVEPLQLSTRKGLMLSIRMI